MKILRPFDIALIVLMVCGAALTFQIKHKAELASAKVRQLNAEIETEQEKINLLNADWALLNQPTGLEKLVERYNAALQLQPVDPGQFGTAFEVPMRPLPEPAQELYADDGALIDDTSTAGIGALIERAAPQPGNGEGGNE